MKTILSKEIAGFQIAKSIMSVETDEDLNYLTQIFNQSVEVAKTQIYVLNLLKR